MKKKLYTLSKTNLPQNDKYNRALYMKPKLRLIPIHETKNTIVPLRIKGGNGNSGVTP